MVLQQAQLNDPVAKEKLKGLTERAITRAESLKGKSKTIKFDDSLALLQNLPPVPENILPSPEQPMHSSPTSPDLFVNQGGPSKLEIKRINVHQIMAIS